VRLHPANLPAGAVFKGSAPYVVQELRVACHTTRYWRARYELPASGSVLAPLPADVLPGSHFGPTLVSYVLDQYHQAHVTQPLLLQQLHDYGIDLSAGQLNRLLTEGNDTFHDEKAEVLAAGLQTAAYIGVDDTGARHQGRNGYCTALGNDLFACFESTDSKSRLNFLQVLHGGRRLCALNDVARAYWERQGLAAAVVEQLGQGPQEFADESAWQARLAELGITGERPAEPMGRAAAGVVPPGGSGSRSSSGRRRSPACWGRRSWQGDTCRSGSSGRPAGLAHAGQKLA
jgi:hypothetical protein